MQWALGLSSDQENGLYSTDFKQIETIFIKEAQPSFYSILVIFIFLFWENLGVFCLGLGFFCLSCFGLTKDRPTEMQYNWFRLQKDKIHS